MIEHALNYLKLGWNVVPVKEDKTPLIEWKNYQKQKVTEDQVKTWWTQWPDANIAVITGGVSGILVIDVEDERGKENLTEYTENGIFEKTLVSQTGGGGWHLFFKHPGYHCSNLVRIFPGVDVRGDGGYVVVPPSTHASNNKYRWVNRTKPVSVPGKLQKSLYKDKAKLNEDNWKEELEEGRRDDEVTRRAGKLIRAGIPPQETVSMLMAWNIEHCKPPLPRRDIERIAGSIGKKEKSRVETEKQSQQSTPFTVTDFKSTLEKYGQDETVWTLKDWLPKATVGLIVAPPGHYKTWMFLDLAVAVSTGGYFLSQFKVSRPGPVLIIQQEDPFSMLFERIGSIMNISPVEVDGENHTVPLPPPFPEIYWHTERTLDLEKPETVEKLEQAVKSIKPTLILIDPLYSAVSTAEYMAKGAQNMLSLKRMRDEYQCSILIAHHTTKKGDGDGRERVWGSQFLNAWLETGWQIRPKGENTVSINRHFKQSRSPGYLVLTFEIDTWSYKVHAEESSEPENIKTKIMEILDSGDVKSQREVANKLGMTGLGTISRLFDELGVKKRGAYYKMPDENGDD